MKITDTHVYFWDGPFSNWSQVTFFDFESNNQFLNSEAAFMYYKAIHFNDKEIAQQIVDEQNPRIVKELGRKIKNYNDDSWALVRYGNMVYVNLLKFSQNEDYGKALINTNGKILVEASPYDKIWGVGLGENDPLILDEKNWKGQNLLGKALMDVRDNYL